MLNNITHAQYTNTSTLRHLLAPRLANDKVTRLFISCSLYLIATTIIFFIVNGFDNRILDGMPVWHKPIRFGFSFLLHFVTLTLLVQLIDEKYRNKLRFSFFAYTAALSIWVESGYIIAQSARGRRSHFNFDTEFETLMYIIMGVGAIFLVLVTFVLGIMIWKYSQKNDSGLRLGAIIGLTLGSVMTFVFASYMSSSPDYLALKNLTNPQLVPYLGWSRTHGDFKPVHFMATHMIQLIPLFGFWIDRSRLNKFIKPRKAVIIFTIVLTLFTFILFALAKMNIPIFAL